MNGATVAVLGAGSWGTALALALTRNGCRTRLWGHRPEHVECLARDRENRRYLPGVKLPAGLEPASGLGDALGGARIALVAVPSQAFGATLQALAPLLPADCGFAWATKGLEHDSGRFLHEVVQQWLGDQRPAAVVSGPSFAREVAAGRPTALTVAATDGAHARAVAALLHGRNLRAYTSTDVVGVELGGALKNVLAIATGVSDGLGLGANSRSALITRGLAEMVRLGTAVGGRQETFMGLAGVGDLILTCTDDQSRNRRFGLALGRGQPAAAACSAIGQVVEGIATTAAVLALARRHGVELPITEQVDHVLRGLCTPRQAVEALLARDPRDEGA